MKKKVRLLVVSIVLGLSLLFVSSVSGVNDEMIFEHAVAQKTLPETKSKLKIVLKKKAAKPKPKVAVKAKAKPKPKAKAKPKAVKKNEITFSGKTIPLVNSQGAAAAPKGNKAGYWRGNGKVNDKKTTHIIGHNPGSFAGMFKLKKGSIIKVVDSDGKTRNYKVYSILTVNDNVYGKNGKDYWSTIFNQKGEAISLQTCINDYWNLIVLAK
ncbi:sortase domain-bontaining protein [Enterococcus alcedinis]|uniref:Sortase n=1 Tax=Enterococcus alcedinis TaxID=1274384 RepID=A0A917JFI0_9ENTE|nr:sortase [Enterococcus alcedinis]MBP2102747.1 sortase (surface protein transpeptidase) [Enterococcus alcedinis]GGI66308.1 hypothetical protein GCM10011482_19620 [Enterococcus alcedinis]